MLKYELDLADPDGIGEKYTYSAYPTFILIDGNGEEFTRFTGFGGEAPQFIERVKNAMKPENSWAFKRARMETEPSYTLDYIRDLNRVYFRSQAQELLLSFFAKRSVKENFSKESVELYNVIIPDMNSPIVEFMLKNKKEVSDAMGEEQYKAFIFSKVNSHLSNKFGVLNLEKPETVTDFETEVKKYNSDPMFSSNFAKYWAAILKNMKAKDTDAHFEDTKNMLLTELNTTERNTVLNLYNTAMRRFNVEIDRDVSRQHQIALYEIAVETEKDPRYIETYKGTLERLKNPTQRGATPTQR